MSLHDKLAQKAVSRGKGAAEFSAAAQKHANATWFYVITAGVVWYFFGWGWALIPIALGAYTAFQSVSSTMIAAKIEKLEQSSDTPDNNFIPIVQAYGKILETSAPAPGTVADVNKLPYTKQQIKEALIAVLRSTDDPQMKEYLKIGYIQLADWQEGVGESNQGLDLSNIDLNQDAKSLAQQVLDQSVGSKNWATVVQKEQEALKQELQELNLW
jgi:hypothetical protein